MSAPLLPAVGMWLHCLTRDAYWRSRRVALAALLDYHAEAHR